MTRFTQPPTSNAVSAYVQSTEKRTIVRTIHDQQEVNVETPKGDHPPNTHSDHDFDDGDDDDCSR